MKQIILFQNNQIEELNAFLRKTNGNIVSYNPFVVEYDPTLNQTVSLFNDKFTIGYRNCVNLLTLRIGGCYPIKLIKEVVITPNVVYVMTSFDQIYSIQKGIKNENYKISEYKRNKFIKTTDIDDEKVSIIYYNYEDRSEDSGLLLSDDEYFGQTFEEFKLILIQICKNQEWCPISEEINSYMNQKHITQIQQKHQKEITKMRNMALIGCAKMTHNNYTDEQDDDDEIQKEPSRKSYNEECQEQYGGHIFGEGLMYNAPLR